MKILLLGASGQLGWQLARSLSVLGEVLALDRRGTASAPGEHAGLCGDLADSEGLARTVRACAPQAIVNAAAFTAVDRAEAEPEAAFAINAQAVEVLAREAQRAGAWLLHYSTDYVFDGSGSRAWTEADRTAPLNAYGRSKLAGEEAVRAHCTRHLILRTSWVFDAWGQNFLKTILRAASQRDTLDVVDDQWGAPTRAALLADLSAHLLARAQASQAGTYHAAAAGETSWHGYACFALQEALAAGVKLRTAPEAVRAVSSSHFKTAARRPANSRLDCTRLRETFALALPPWQAGVAAVVRELAAHGAIGARS